MMMKRGDSELTTRCGKRATIKRSDWLRLNSTGWIENDDSWMSQRRLKKKEERKRERSDDRQEVSAKKEAEGVPVSSSSRVGCAAPHGYLGTGGCER